MAEKRGKRRLSAKERGRVLLRLFFLLLGIAVLLAAMHGLSERIFGSRISFVKTASGTIYDTVPGKGFTIYWETLYTASHDGSFQPLAAEWADINSGETVGILTVAATDMRSKQIEQEVKAAHAGIVSYDFDGMEGIVTPDNLDQLSLASLDQRFQVYDLSASAGKTVQAASPIFKIIDVKGEPRFYLRLDNSSFEAIPSGDLLLRFAGGEAVTGHVLRQESIGSAYGLTLMLPAMPASFYKERKKTLEVVLASYQGIVIPTAALAERDGEEGVYTAENGIASFSPVTVNHVVGTEAVVTGLEEGIYIIDDASQVKEGQFIQ